MLKKFVRSTLASLGFQLRRIPPEEREKYDIPDSEMYRPRFSPWLGYGDFGKYYGIAAPRTLVSPESCYVLRTLLLQCLNVRGDIWECGVYKGGTAAMIASLLRNSVSKKKLFLFDTFEGMPETDPIKDWVKKGVFNDTSAEAVIRYRRNRWNLHRPEGVHTRHVQRS